MNRTNVADQLYFPRQALGDTNASISNRFSVAALTATLTAARTYTLPAASAYPADLPLDIVDEAGSLSSTLTMTIAANGNDKINGLVSLLLTTPYTALRLVSNGSDRWTIRAFGLATLSNVPNPAVAAGLPPGAIVDFGMNTPPAGWLKCNGAAISRTTYAALYAAVQTVWGTGDGSTTFNLPDFRGAFRRAWDDSRGVDSGRAFGSYQTDSLGSHNHAFIYNGSGVGTLYTSPNPSSSGYPSLVQGDGTNYYGLSIGSAGGSETRSKNYAVLPCMKY